MVVEFNWISHYMIWTKCFCVKIASISFVVEAFNGWQNDLLGANVDKTHESHWCWVFTILTWTTSCSMFSRHDKFSPLLTLIFFLSIAKSFGSLECQELKIKPIFNSKYTPFWILLIYIAAEGLSVSILSFLMMYLKYFWVSEI